MISNKMEGQASTSRLSDAALVLLSEAANRQAGMVLPAPTSLRARGGALEKVLAKLLRQGFVEEIPVGSPEQAWRSDEQGSRIGLKIATAGLKAIGAPALQEDDPDQTRSDRARRKGRPAKEASRGSIPAPAAKPASAEAEAVRPLAAGFRPGSKLALLVEQLSAPSGTRIANLVRLLGWQPHTVRAALKQRGYDIARSRNEQGETVYRLGSPEPESDSDPEQAAA
jgi:hypothetical protein